LTQLELFGSNGGLIWACGVDRSNDKYFETTVPKDETAVGFKVVTDE